MAGACLWQKSAPVEVFCRAERLEIGLQRFPFLEELCTRPSVYVAVFHSDALPVGL